jgi:DivIVA domain-containing protein
MIDPQDIERVEFSTTRLKGGYDPDEVDSFLDRVADTLRAVNDSNGNLEAENVTLRRRVAELERRADDTPTTQLPVIQAAQEPTAAAARLLDLAQKTADEVTAQAQAEAVEIIKRADESARDITNAATVDADNRRRAAEAEAYRAEQEAARIKELRDTTRAHLASQLTDLHNKLGETP